MADPIWLQKLKRLLSQPTSSERITQERPNFTGTAGYGPSDVDPLLAAYKGGPGWGSAMAPSTMTKVPATGKKGLNWKNFMNAAQKLRSPTGMDFGRVSGRAGGPRPSAPSPRALGVDAAQMATAGDPRKKFWEQGLWRGIMG